MSIQYDLLPGQFARESFAIKRQPSICSVHCHKPQSRQQSFDIHSVRKISESAPVRRFNNSFHYFRFIVVLMGGMSVGFMSFLRLNITVAILNMVNQTQIYIEEHKLGTDLVEYFGEGYREVGEFDWNNERQQLIISYYMIAYTLPQLYTTKLAIKMGVRWSIALSVGICALSCLLTPILAYQGWEYVTILRLVNGLGASAILPMMVYLIELWMPAHESSLGLAIVQTVQAILFTLSPLLSALLAEIHWKWAFYVPAVAALIFCIMWICMVCDSPGDCWFVSQAELDAICGCKNNVFKNLECRLASDGRHQKITKQELEPLEESISWTSALRFKSFYALTLVWIFYQCSFGAFSFLIPSYMRQVLKVPIRENGMQCFLMQAGCMISVIWPQPILRALQNRYNCSLTSSRRLVMALICIVAASTLTLVAAYHEHQVILFSINRIFHLSTDTIVTSTIMSQYSEAGVSSIIYSVINAIGNFSTVFFCMLVGAFLDWTGQSRECWSMVFVVMGLMNVALLVLFSTVINSNSIDLKRKNEQVDS